MHRNLLLLSNSTNAGEEYLAWPRQYIANFLKKFSVRSFLFIPYAGVREGCLLWIEGDTIELKGNTSLRVFIYGQAPAECKEGDSLDFLLGS